MKYIYKISITLFLLFIVSIGYIFYFTDLLLIKSSSQVSGNQIYSIYDKFHLTSGDYDLFAKSDNIFPISSKTVEITSIPITTG